MQWFQWAGTTIVLALSGYAGWLLGRLWQQHRRRRHLERLRRQQACDSLEIIARSLIAGQVNVTEAALRMEAMLDNIDDPRPRADVSAVHALAGDSRHLAIGRERESLTADERRRQDRERESVEANYAEPVEQAARRLLEVLPAWRQ